MNIRITAECAGRRTELYAMTLGAAVDEIYARAAHAVAAGYEATITLTCRAEAEPTDEELAERERREEDRDEKV